MRALMAAADRERRSEAPRTPARNGAGHRAGSAHARNGDLRTQ